MKNELITLIARYNNMDEKDRSKAVEALLEDPGSAVYVYNSFELAIMRGAIDKCVALTSLICALLKKKAQVNSLNEHLNHINSNSLVKALSLSSPKLRKNAARIMGYLKNEAYAPLLVTALNKETQNYVRPSIISAIGSIGEKDSLELIKQIYENSDKAAKDKNEAAEISALKTSLLKNEDITIPKFSGLKSNREVVLRTMPGFAHELKARLGKLSYEANTTKSNDHDVTIVTDNLDNIFAIRTFSDLYFLVERKVSLDGNAIFQALSKFDLISFLKETHAEGYKKLYYRIEIPGADITQQQRSEYIKEISSYVNRLPSIEDNPYNYQFELLIETYSRSCDIYIGLKTIKDTRFDYRKNTLPASISPYTAAIIAQYLKKYANPSSKVLDPFCGTGTILIERGKAAPYLSLSGVDIKKKAIDFASENTKLAGMDIDYILSDILKFNSKTKYTEIISNMPFGNRVGTHAANVEIYNGFFRTLRRYLAKGGILALYTMEGRLLESVSEKSGFEVIEKHKMYAGGLKPTLYILKQKKSS